MREKIDIICEDGQPLAATFFKSQTSPAQPEPILIAPATGIVQGFYAAFAEWLSTQGYDVMTFDFSGIGASLQGELRHCQSSIADWGMRDLPAAIHTLLRKTKAKQVILIGHSAGGQLLGLAKNYAQVKKVVAIAGSTGHVPGLRGRTKLLAPVMFKIVFPVSRVLKGYATTKMIGMGENLPAKVAADWAEYCSKGGYAMNAVRHLPHLDYHAAIRCPIVSIAAKDDEIATPANVKQFLQCYPNAPTRMYILNPKDHGHQAIGHMLMFKKSHANLWPLIQAQLAELPL